MAAAAAHETAAARDQARLCEKLRLEEGLAACRAALALGIGPARRGAVREMLAKHLVRLERWDELAAHFREDSRLQPTSATAWYRLGSTLLFALGQSAEALPALQEAARLDPTDASTHVALGTALQALGRDPEAVAAFDEALRLDPAVLDGRPAAKSVLEAARRGERWP
jgi:Flp pilus assembly protein TadD